MAAEPDAAPLLRRSSCSNVGQVVNLRPIVNRPPRFFFETPESLYMTAIAVVLLLTLNVEQDDVARFGTTVVIPSGLRGEVYSIRRYSSHLPDFAKRKPMGVVYTSSLNVPPQSFEQGFPGVTKRSEWFAIDYTGRFWIEKPGAYRFDLTSDDGSKLYIDRELVVDNDGAHPPVTKFTTVTLAGGIHRIRVSYFQGPRYEVALVLRIAGEGESPRVFSTDEFKPPADPEKWSFPSAGPPK